MNKFSWYDARSVEDALKNVTATASEVLAGRKVETSAVFKAGGVDLLGLIKEGLVAPEKIINIRNIPGLDKISYDSKTGLKIGANVTLDRMEEDESIKKYYKALHEAVAHAGTPQIRYSATLGGNLAQRTRCWYFRSLDHECYRKGSGTCYAQNGENEFHSIINNRTCASVHSSSVATALLAFNARVEIAKADGKKKEVNLDEFFVHPETDSRTENVLKSDEMITALIIPPVKNNVKSSYIKHGARESHDWAIADVAVVMELSGNKCKHAEIALGAAAPIPFTSKEAGSVLKGAVINEKIAESAAEASMKGATPLSGNGYKVPVFKAIIKRAILQNV
jgi:xanthine dehydrogenase YagS FAD-binding subunit